MPLFRFEMHSKKSQRHFHSPFQDNEHAACGMTGFPGELKITNEPGKVTCGNCIVHMTVKPPSIQVPVQHTPEQPHLKRVLYEDRAGGQVTVWERDPDDTMCPLAPDGRRLMPPEAPTYQQLVDALDGALYPLHEIDLLRRIQQHHHDALREENIL